MTLSPIPIVGFAHDSAESRAWFSAKLASPRARLAAPLLCVVGERDRATELYTERYAEWTALAERVELATIPLAGHYFLRRAGQAHRRPGSRLVGGPGARGAAGRGAEPARPLRTLEDTLPDATLTPEIPDDLDAIQDQADRTLMAAAR